MKSLDGYGISSEWFQSLPLSLAVRLTLMFAARRVLRFPARFSYSQGAEDLLFRYISKYQIPTSEPGNYVDVGCNLPVMESNTFDLYLRGWRGLNIDANEDLIRVCKNVRKKDTSIVAAVSDVAREVVFHKSNTHLVSTIDESRLKEWEKVWDYREEDAEVITTRTLTSILDEVWQAERPIDLLSIDVEGQELQVLKGLDFTKYRPRTIIVESWEFHRFRETDVFMHLTGLGYDLRHFAYVNAFFTDGSLQGWAA